ncbi:AsnC family transcriptional regulator [Candidatus Woesearchaeota archaeon]|nr:AsnC family transcriptional regulator [Candidatus Woesearchaeota archaeon]
MPKKRKEVKTDLKDRKILYELDLNSRQSLSKISKKVGLPKNVVAYRINRLRKIGIIKHFYTLIDASKLGYISFRIYLTFQNTTPKTEKEITNYFINNRLTYWMGSIEGKYDLGIQIWVKDINDFYPFWEETLMKYRKYFQEQDFSVYYQLYHYVYSYLLGKPIKEPRAEITGGGKAVSIDKTDFKILGVIAPNSRIPTTEIADKLNLTPMIVKYRIKKLISLGVIQGFRTNIDFSLLGYQHFKSDIRIEAYQEINKVLSFIKTNPNLIYIDKSAGYSDLEAEYHFKTLKEFHSAMDELKIKFPSIIKNCRHFIYSEILKMHYLPED